MIILSAEKFEILWRDVIIKDVSFSLQEKDKVGIIGINGAGKSTLFKIIAGIEDKDKGQLYIGRNTSIGYMPQFLEFSQDRTLWDEMLRVFNNFIEIEKDETTGKRNE